MRILALQLKRIGDLVLTAPAIAALRQVSPAAHITLAAYGSAAELLTAIPGVDAGIALGKGRVWTPWQQVVTGSFDRVFDFTGSDRSALAAALSRAPERVAFASVKNAGLRRLAYTRFVDSPVRDAHTADHYCHLVRPPPVDFAGPGLLLPDRTIAAAEAILRDAKVPNPFILIHPGTARTEKYWPAQRWADVITHLSRVQRHPCILTGGRDAYEADHLQQITARCPVQVVNLAGEIDLLTLAALARSAHLVVSCDTAIVHLAAAFETPQIALFGPTNPFHWRPRHPHAIVLSAAHPEGPLVEFTPRMRGAPMADLSTETVIRAIDLLLAAPHWSRSPP